MIDEDIPDEVKRGVQEVLSGAKPRRRLWGDAASVDRSITGRKWARQISLPHGRMDDREECAAPATQWTERI